MLDVILKRFDQPDETRTFPKGKFELIQIGGMTIGRATYQPGWKWSVDVGAATRATMCQVEHVGMVVSGKATAAMEDGRVVEMKAGTFSTLHRDTTVGSSAMNHIFLCIFLAQKNMQPGRSDGLTTDAQEVLH